MLYSIFVFGILVVVSGFIAYLGDYIGRYLGKKRLSVFGLRPKHTAIVSTVITGMIISFIALAVVTCVNREFREVLIHGNQIIENNEKLELKSKELSKKNMFLQETNKVLAGEQQNLSKKNASLEKITFVLELKNKNLNIKAKENESKAKNLKIKASKLEKDVVKLLFDYKNNMKKLDTSEKDKKIAEANIDKFKKDIEKLKEEYNDISEKNDNMGLLLLQKQQDLDNTVKKYASQEENLKKIEAQLGDAKKDLDKTLKSLEIASEELQTYTELRLHDVIIRQNDEFIRCSIDKGSTKSEIEDTLISLYSAAEQRCENMIVKYVKKSQGMILAYKSDKGEVVLVDEKELLSQAAELISENRNKQTLVIISSAGNFTMKDLENNPVITQIKILEDKLIYKKGDLVIKKYFDGKLTEPYVFNNVYEFINNDLSKAVIDKGMVYYQQPQIGKDRDKITKNIEVQLNLTKNIKESDIMCLVNVTAKNDIYSHDIYNSDLFDYEVRSVK